MKAIFDAARGVFAQKKRSKWVDLPPDLKALTEFESSLRGFSNKITHLCTEVRPDNWEHKDYDLKRTVQNATYELLTRVPDLAGHPVIDVPDDTVMLQQMLAKRLYNNTYQVETTSEGKKCVVDVKITSAMPQNGKYLVQLNTLVSIIDDGVPLVTRKARIHKYEFDAPKEWTLRSCHELYTYVINSLNRIRRISVADWMIEFDAEVKLARQEQETEWKARKAFTALPRAQRKWILDNAKDLSHDFRLSH